MPLPLTQTMRDLDDLLEGFLTSEAPPMLGVFPISSQLLAYVVNAYLPHNRLAASVRFRGICSEISYFLRLALRFTTPSKSRLVDNASS